MKRFRLLALPYAVWMVILVVFPLLIMVALAFLDIQGLDFSTATFTFSNFKATFDKTYFEVFLRSMGYAFITTIICIVIGYPIAYIISKLKPTVSFIVLLLFILPMWTNMLLRIQSLNMLLLPEGFMKNVFGISINLSGSTFSVILAMVVIYLPFMIFPIYSVLEKQDPLLIEASQDLGASEFKTFRKVTLPLSLKGVASGVIMVFLPAATSFTIPEIMSRGKLVLIGTIIEQKFKSGSNYGTGSLMSLFLIAFIFIAIFISNKLDKEGATLI
jgi:spermidine/putrescine transport system permease protein